MGGWIISGGLAAGALGVIGWSARDDGDTRAGSVAYQLAVALGIVGVIVLVAWVAGYGN